MPDYKEMYLHLMRETEKSIRILIEAQQECERLYLESAAKFDWPDLSAPDCGVEFCLGLRQQAAVLCDGTVAPCCLDGDGQIPLGNLFSQTFDEIIASPRAQALIDGFSRRCPTEELCRRCGYATRFNKG